MLLAAADLLQRAALFEQFGRYASALDAAFQAVCLLEAQPQQDGDPPDLLLQAWSAAGSLYRQLGRYPEAETLLRRALEGSIARHGESADQTALARNQLGVLYKYSGQFDQGEALYRQALADVQARHGNRHALTALLCHNLGGLYHARGDFASGEPFARQAWEINRARLGETDPQTLADAESRPAPHRRCSHFYQPAPFPSLRPHRRPARRGGPLPRRPPRRRV